MKGLEAFRMMSVVRGADDAGLGRSRSSGMFP